MVLSPENADQWPDEFADTSVKQAWLLLPSRGALSDAL